MPLIIQEGLNLFVGDAGPDNSKHLNLDNVNLPDFEELTQMLYSGGSIGQLDVGGMGLKSLEMTFKLTGWDPQAMSQFGVGARSQLPYTFYGLARDKAGNTPKEVKGVVRGRMVRVGMDNIKRGDLFGTDFAIREIIFYELHFNKEEKYFYDWKSSEYRVDGVTQNADERDILRLPTGI
jgi:P2 family phage contractile tail tube protein